MNALATWVDRLTGNASARNLGRCINRSHTAVSAWMKDGGMPAEVVIDIARCFSGDAVEGMLAAGILTGADLDSGGLRNAVRMAPTIYLTEELHFRSVSWEEARSSGVPWKPAHRRTPIPTEGITD